MSTEKRGGGAQPQEAGSPAAGPPGAEKRGSTPPLELVAAKLTDVGRARDHNEDYVGLYVPPDPQQRARKGAMYLVADGMGGHQAGEVASQGAVELAIGQYYSDEDPDVAASLVRAFRAANRLIHKEAQADEARSGMGTTLVAAVVLGRRVYVASVGDSRAYLINQKGTRQITEDHSWVNEQVRMGLLTPEQARRHPQRNVVTRALGSRPTVEVDLFEGEISEGDRLLLCTDGVTGHLEDSELASLVQNHPPEQALRQIVAQANERGGHDNMGLVLVSAQKARAPAATTVAAPAIVPAPLVRRRRRLSPVLAALVAVVAVALLAAAGLGAWWLMGGRQGTAGPDTTPTLGTPVSSATAPAAQSPSAEVAEDTPAALATEAPPATGGLPSDATPEATPTEGALATPTEGTPATPTVTLAPVETSPSPAPTSGTPSPTRRPQPTETASPTSAPTPYPPPELVAPAPEAELSDAVVFEWLWNHEALGPQLFFDLRIGLQEEASTGVEPLGVMAPTQDLRGEVDLEGVDVIQGNRGRTNKFYWTVVVVRKACAECSPEIVGQWSEKRPFTYTGPPSSARTLGVAAH